MPIKDFSCTALNLPTFYSKYLIVSGGTTKENGASNAVWILLENNGSINHIISRIPNTVSVIGSSLFFYDEKPYLMISTSEKNKLMYSENFGLDWIEATENQLFPSNFTQRSYASVITDADHYIWVFGGVSNTQTQLTDLWRGRLNKLTQLKKHVGCVLIEQKKNFLTFFRFYLVTRFIGLSMKLRISSACSNFHGLISIATSSLYSQEFPTRRMLWGFLLKWRWNKTFFLQSRLSRGMSFVKTSPFTALKANLLAGQVYGDTRDSDNAFPTSEQIDFKRSFAEVGTHIEWNFLPYSNKYRYLGTRSYTPYLFVGAGLTYAPKERNFVDLHIPFGIGMKFKLKNRFI